MLFVSEAARPPLSHRHRCRGGWENLSPALAGCPAGVCREDEAESGCAQPDQSEQSEQGESVDESVGHGSSDGSRGSVLSLCEFVHDDGNDACHRKDDQGHRRCMSHDISRAPVAKMKKGMRYTEMPFVAFR